MLSSFLLLICSLCSFLGSLLIFCVSSTQRSSCSSSSCLTAHMWFFLPLLTLSQPSAGQTCLTNKWHIRTFWKHVIMKIYTFPHLHPGTANSINLSQLFPAFFLLCYYFFFTYCFFMLDIYFWLFLILKHAETNYMLHKSFQLRIRITMQKYNSTLKVLCYKQPSFFFSLFSHKIANTLFPL